MVSRFYVRIFKYNKNKAHGKHNDKNRKTQGCNP